MYTVYFGSPIPFFQTSSDPIPPCEFPPHLLVLVLFSVSQSLISTISMILILELASSAYRASQCSQDLVCASALLEAMIKGLDYSKCLSPMIANLNGLYRMVHLF